jgi:hypothetical protein
LKGFKTSGDVVKTFGSTASRIQKIVIDEKYGAEEPEKYAECDKLMRPLFVRPK